MGQSEVELDARAQRWVWWPSVEFWPSVEGTRVRDEWAAGCGAWTLDRVLCWQAYSGGRDPSEPSAHGPARASADEPARLSERPLATQQGGGGS